MQKVKEWWKIVSFVAVAVAFGLMMASCAETGDEDDDDGGSTTTTTKKYSVTLNAGERSGVYNSNLVETESFAKGETVTIFAGTKYKKLFDGWESDDVDVKDVYFTTFKMPAYDVTITANWADADTLNVRFTWEKKVQSPQDMSGVLLSIAASYEEVEDWYTNEFNGPTYNDVDATDYPYFVGNRDVKDTLYSCTIHGTATTPHYKGKYQRTYEGNYTAVATVQDTAFDNIFDIVANYTLSLEESGGKKFFEVGFDVLTLLAGEDPSELGWLGESYANANTAPLLTKTKAAKLLKKVQKDNVTYYVFKRAAKK